MEDLKGLYDRAKVAYEKGEPIMSDIEFDALEKKLGLENKGYVGTHHKKSYTIEHPYLMGSLSKIQVKFNKEDLTIHFDEYVSPIKKYLDKSYYKLKPDYRGDWYFETTPKYDGCSFECVIDSNKNLVSVSTRGDGICGKDIKVWFEEEYKKNILPRLDDFVSNNFDDHDWFFLDKFVIRGECLVRKDVFKKKYLGQFKMPRSFVAGVLAQDWEGTAKQIEMRNDLCWMCYDYRSVYENKTIIEHDYSGYDDEKWKSYNLPNYSYLNFPGNKPSICESTMKIHKYGDIGNFVEIYKFWEEYRKNCEFELDGFVIKPGAFYRLQDGDRTRQEDCVAIKFTPEIVDTVIKDIEWNVGKDGEYYPTGILETVIIGGKDVNRVSLANYNTVIKKQTGIGSKVKISLSGDIISFLYEVIEYTNNYNLPSDSYVENNEDCLHLMKKMTEEDKMYIRFINSVNVLKPDGIGEKVAEKIYKIYPCENILDVMSNISYIKEELDDSKSSQNIINSLMERRKTLNIQDIIQSMGYENCGEKNSLYLAKKYSGLNPDTKGIPTTIIELGNDNTFHFHIGSYMETFDIKPMVEETNSDKIPVILTGAPFSGTKAQWLARHPEYVETTSWKEVKILFTNDLDSSSSKMTKARKNGIEIRLYED